MKQKKLYLVGRAFTKLPTNLGIDIDMCWIDGQFGAAPVFTRKRDAKKFAQGSEIMEFHIVPIKEIK